MRRIILLFWLLASMCPLLQAQEQARPKIVLVLSGGGARGFAHIGVLQWFEEHRIPVDAVVGTSMGGLIGGMYATGMTPAELREMTTKINWTEMFRSVPAFDTLSFRRKEDRLEFPNYLELGLKGGLKFPPGVNPGLMIGLFLDRYTLPYSTIHNFDELPVPFRCVATDMVEGKQVILGEGSLSSAMQATMAIPGVFFPVDIDGKLLVSDGGLLNNVPTDVAETLNADVIIAVNIGSPLGTRESLGSLSGMLGQTISVAMNQNIVKNLDQTLHPKLKVIITPELKGYQTLDFEHFKAITELGYQKAQEMASQLTPYAVSEADWQEYITARQSRIRRDKDLAPPEFIRVSGTGQAEQKALAAALQGHIAKPVDRQAIEADLTTLWGRGRYASLSYELMTEQDRTGLLIRTTEKGYAPPFLNVGLEINNTQTDVFDFNLRARVTLMDLKQQGSEWRLDGSLGSRLLFGGEYYKLIGRTGFFVAPRGFIEQTKTGYFSDKVQLGEYQLETELIGGDIGYNVNSTNELRLGYEFGNQEGKVRIGDQGLPDGGGKFSAARLQWVHISTDSAVIPTRGWQLASSATWNFDVPILAPNESDQEFPQASARASFFFPFGTRGTLFLIGEGDTTFDKNAPALDKFRLGGLMRISAASRDEFLGNHILYASIGYLRTLKHLPLLLGDKLSVGLWYEAGSAYDQWDSADYHQSLAAAVIAETALGPIFVGAGFGDQGRNNFFFALGRIF